MRSSTSEARVLAGLTCEMRPICRACCGVIGSPKRTRGNAKRGKRVLAEVGHDRGRREPEFHFRKSQRRAFRHVNEIAHDREAETEAKRVALHFRDADQWRNSQGALEFDKPRGFVVDRRGVAARALAPRAENFAARANAQDARAGMRCFAAKLREHRIKHRAGDFIFLLGIIQREIQHIAGPLDHHPDGGIRAGKFSWFG